MEIQGMNVRRKTKSKPAGMIQGITRGLNTIFQERVYSPGGAGGAISSIGGSGGGCRDGSVENDEGGTGGGGGGAGGASGTMENTGGGGAVNAGAVNVPLHKGQRINCPAY
jgi:hypothetical protein